MEEKKVQNITELNDEHLEQVSGGADSSGVQTQATVCSKCGKSYPKDPFYFARSRDKRTGYCSQCKACQKAKRDAAKEAK